MSAFHDKIVEQIGTIDKEKIRFISYMLKQGYKLESEVEHDPKSGFTTINFSFIKKIK